MSRMSNEWSFKRWAGASKNPVISESITVDEEHGQVVPMKPHHGLEEFLNHCYSHSSALVPHDPRKQTWADVVHCLNEAQDQIDKHELRQNKCWRSISKIMGATKATTRTTNIAAGSHAMARWVTLIPEEAGFGVLRGGLVLIFTAVLQAKENKLRVFDVFRDIPDLLEEAADSTEPFEDKDEDLKVVTEDFCNTLFHAIPQLVKILHHKDPILKQVWNAFTLSQSAKLQIDENIMDIERACRRLRRKVYSLSNKINIQTIGEIPEKMEEIAGKVSSKVASGMMEEMRFEMSEQFRKLKHELYGKGPCGIFMIIKDSDAAKRYQNLLLAQMFPPPSRSTSPAPPPLLRIPWIDVWKTLGTSHIQHLDDRKFVVELDHTFNERCRAEAQSLLHTPQFTRWLGRPGPDSLLVNCEFSTTNPGINSAKASPLSSLLAVLGIALSQDPKAIVLTFFCGQHLLSDDDGDDDDDDDDDDDGSGISRGDPSHLLYGPQGLLRSLIAQLALQVPRDNFPCPDDISFPTRSSHLSFRTLRYLLYHLLRRIQQQTTVYIMIDGLSWYEGCDREDEWGTAFLDVISIINEAAFSRHTPVHVHVKILLASACRSQEVLDVVENTGGELLILGKDCNHNDMPIDRDAISGNLNRELMGYDVVEEDRRYY